MAKTRWKYFRYCVPEWQEGFYHEWVSGQRPPIGPAPVSGNGHGPVATPAAVWGALTIVYVLWGSTYLAIREAIQTMPPLLMASTRFLIAGGLLYAWAIRRGEHVADRPGRAQWLAAFVVGGLLLLGGNGLVVYAEGRIPSGITALLVATVPLWMVLFGMGFFRERITPLEIAGVLVGFVGIGLLVGLPGAGEFDLIGCGAAVLASASWAVGSLYQRRAPLPSRPLVSTAMQMLAGGVLLAVVGVAFGELGRIDVEAISLRSLLGWLYLIVFGSLVAFSAYVWLLKVAPITLVGTYAYVNPIVAVFLGWALLSEPITSMTLVAAAVIVLAVAIVVTARSRAAVAASRASARRAGAAPASREATRPAHR